MALPSLLLAALVGQAGPTTTLSAEDRVPAVVVVLTPFGSGSATGTSRLITALDAVLHRRTDLRALSPEQAGLNLDAIRDCPARVQLTCWSATATRRGRASGYLVSLSVRRLDERRDRIALTLVDLSAARALDPSLSPDAREDALFRRTPRTPPIVVPGDDPVTLRTALDNLFQAHLADALTAAGHWQPFGAVDMPAPCDGCEVRVDGQSLGFARAGPLTIEGLRAGARRVTFVDRGTRLAACTIRIVAGRRVPPEDGSCERLTPLREPQSELRWAGLIVGIAGAALVAYGAAQSAGGPSSVCVVPTGASADDCESLGAATFGTASDPALTDQRDAVRSPGPPIVAVGAGLLGLGATWTAGTWLWDELPAWAQILVGLGVGGAAFGVTSAAGGGL